LGGWERGRTHTGAFPKTLKEKEKVRLQKGAFEEKNRTWKIEAPWTKPRRKTPQSKGGGKKRGPCFS